MKKGGKRKDKRLKECFLELLFTTHEEFEHTCFFYVWTTADCSCDVQSIYSTPFYVSL